MVKIVNSDVMFTLREIHWYPYFVAIDITVKTLVKRGPSRKSVMNTQNGLITDMAKNGYSIGPRVVLSDPWVFRDAKAVLARTPPSVSVR